MLRPDRDPRPPPVEEAEAHAQKYDYPKQASWEDVILPHLSGGNSTCK